MARLFTREFVSVLVTQAIFGFSFASFFLLPKFLVEELGQGPAAVGRVTAAFYVPAILLGPAMGALVDRRGRRAFLTAGALLQAVTCAAFVAVDEMGPAVYLLRALHGVAFAMAFVAGSALAVDESPPDRMALALGIFGLTFLSNNAVAPAAVESISVRWGWQPAFLLSAAAALVSALLSLRLRERARPAPDAEIPRLLDMVKSPRSLWIGAVIGLSGATFGAMFTLHQPYALELGITTLRTFFVWYTAAAIAARLGLGPFTDRIGLARVSIAALALYGVAALGMARLAAFGLAPIGAAFGVAHGLFYPTFNALALQGTGPHERGKVVALFNGAFNVGVSAGTLALGLLAQTAGYGPVFVVAALCGWAAMAVLVAVGRRA